MAITMAKKARKAESSDGDLIYTAEAAEIIGIDKSVFRWHARKGKIAPKQTIQIGGMSVPLYDRGEVLALKEALRPPGGKRGRGGPRRTDN